MIFLITPDEAWQSVARLLKERRLLANMTQAELSGRANVKLPTLRKFEKTGKISLESFMKLAFVLDAHDAIIQALQPKRTAAASLDELLASEPKPRRRAAPRKDAS